MLYDFVFTFQLALQLNEFLFNTSVTISASHSIQINCQHWLDSVKGCTIDSVCMLIKQIMVISEIGIGIGIGIGVLCRVFWQNMFKCPEISSDRYRSAVSVYRIPNSIQLDPTPPITTIIELLHHCYFSHSKIDYCYSLLLDLPAIHKRIVLTRPYNSVARVLSPKLLNFIALCTPIFKSLHCLKINESNTKVLSLTYGTNVNVTQNNVSLQLTTQSNN